MYYFLYVRCNIPTHVWKQKSYREPMHENPLCIDKRVYASNGILESSEGLENFYSLHKLY